ncbi:MFS transporter [Francisella sp. Scap27]|uniref:MFS transporter n=1 Tax=Francisella sp. Scap27 TaxID=2589986 RepID=UPI002117B728|nr:MFS transporter [Francisella sp. Scap27]
MIKYNTRRWNPFLIAIPDIGIGMFWSLTGTIGSWIAYQHTSSALLVGLLLSMAAFTGIFMQTIAGIVSDKTPTNFMFGKRTTWLLFGLILTCIFQMLWAFAPNYATLFIIAFCTYASINFFQGPYYTLVVEVVDFDQVPFAILLARTTAQIGTILIGLIAAFMWNAGGDLISCIVICLILIIPTVAILPTIVKERPENQTKNESKLSLNVFKNKNNNMLFLATFCAMTGFGAFMPMMGGYMNEYLSFNINFTGSLVVAFGVSSVIIGFCTAIALKRLNITIKKLFGGGMLIFAISLFGASFLKEDCYCWYTVTVFVALGFILTQVSSYTIIARLAPDGKLGEYMGWLNMFFSLPQLLILISGGWLIDAGFGSYLYIIASIILFIGFIAVTQIKLPTETIHQES